MIRKTFHILNSSNEPINIDLRHREDAHEAPTVILVHGFKGFKNWGFFPDLADRLAMAGYVTVALNFSRNGIGYDYNTFEQLDKFAENTHSHESEDLQMVLDGIKNEKIGKRVIDINRLALLGHSRGGGTAILKAAEIGAEIKCLITWASVATFFRYSDDHIKQWKKEGFIEIENTRTKQMMPMKRSYWDDLNKNKKKFDIIKAVESIEIPTLFIHGTGDETIPHLESETLHDKCGSFVKRIELIEGTGHTFGAKHPFDKAREPYINACDFTEHWLDNYLNIL